MSFTHLAPPVVIGGLAALWLALFLLQRLRVRHRAVSVVTTLFWREATEEARARVRTRRFRHPLAYLLAALIASLVWLALAGPRERSDDPRDHVILLDASAATARAGRFEAAIRAARALAGSLPQDRRRVLLCAADTRAILLPSEPVELLDLRLEGVLPAACPSRIEDAVVRLARSAGAERSIWIAGDADVSPWIRQRLPRGVLVRRAPPVDPDAVEGGAPENAGVVALGLADAASGRWDAADVLIRVAGTEAPPRVIVGKTPLDRPLERLAGPDSDGATFVARDVLLRGETLAARLPGGDALALDDEARIYLPSRPQIRVYASPALPDAVLRVLARDPAVRLVEDADEARVRVVAPADAASPGPELRFVPASDRTAAFAIEHDDPTDAEEALADALTRLGLFEIDATSLATRAGREIRVETRAAEERRIEVWEDLLGDDYDFTRSPSFPLFMGRAVRFLARAPELTPRVAAGEPLDERGAFFDSSGRALEPAGAPFKPPVAGAYRTASGGRVEAALLDANATAMRLPPVDAEAPPPSRGPPIATILIGLAFALLLCEWWLYRTDRIP